MKSAGKKTGKKGSGGGKGRAPGGARDARPQVPARATVDEGEWLPGRAPRTDRQPPTRNRGRDRGREPGREPGRDRTPPSRPQRPAPTARPSPKDGPQPLAGRPVVLPAGVVDAWAAAVLELGKIPRGINRKEHSEEELLGHVMRQELPLISDIWSVFTQERGELSKALLSGRREAVAYLVGFHLANAARAQLTWMRATERYDLPQWLRSLATPLHWHDLGCGTGAVAQAMGDALLTAGLTPEKLDLHLYDATGTLLDAARTLFGHAGVRMQTHRVGLEALAVDRFLKTGEGGVSAYSLGYVWNELAKNPVARARLLKLFEAHAERQDRALVMILEPAMQNISRDAMTLRDQLVAAGYVPLYHCPAATPCPMLEKTRDWCYSEGDWQRPKAMYQLDRALGMDRSRLTGTFFLFASAALAPELKAFGKPMPVVVGRPLRVSGTAAFDYLLCTGADLKKQPPAPGKKCLARGLPLNA